MHEAAVQNNTAILSYLLTQGADMDVPDCFGKTPLMIAVMGGLYEAAEFLLRRGANANEKTIQNPAVPVCL